MFQNSWLRAEHEMFAGQASHRPQYKQYIQILLRPPWDGCVCREGAGKRRNDQQNSHATQRNTNNVLFRNFAASACAAREICAQSAKLQLGRNASRRWRENSVQTLPLLTASHHYFDDFAVVRKDFINDPTRNDPNKKANNNHLPELSRENESRYYQQ